jgi:hypothetical protein
MSLFKWHWALSPANRNSTDAFVREHPDSRRRRERQSPDWRLADESVCPTIPENRRQMQKLQARV